MPDGRETDTAGSPPTPGERASAVQSDRIEWTGDLDDDCTAVWCGLGAHAECMDEFSPDDPDSSNAWYCAVWRINPNARVGADNEAIFHSSDDDILPLSGPAARKLCEIVMRAAAIRAAVAEERPKYTPVPPAGPGWYWHREAPGGEAVVLEIIADAYGAMAVGAWDDDENRYPTAAEFGGEWAGPLSPPE